MLGSYASRKSAPSDEESPEARSARHLRALRYLVTVLVAIHVGIFVMLVILAFKAGSVVTYYRPYLAESLSGSNVALTVDNAMNIVSAVSNMTTIGAAAMSAGASSMGFSSPPAPSAPASRALLADDSVSPAQLALAGLFDAVARKVDEFDVTAPAHFLTWATQQQPGPYIRELLTLIRYGEATMGTVLAALGATVNPALVGGVV